MTSDNSNTRQPGGEEPPTPTSARPSEPTTAPRPTEVGCPPAPPGAGSEGSARRFRTIPEIRARMIELAGELGCPELRELAEETRRRKPVRRAPPRKPDPSPALQDRIKRYASHNPDVSYHDIAVRFGTTSGRVSEAVAGKRE